MYENVEYLPQKQWMNLYDEYNTYTTVIDATSPSVRCSNPKNLKEKTNVVWLQNATLSTFSMQIGTSSGDNVCTCVLCHASASHL